MQSVETERALADLDRELIARTVVRLLDQRTSNDLEAMLKAADPNIVYELRGSQRHYPFFGRRTGIDQIRLMLRHVATEFQNLGSRIHRVLIDGNNVAVERTATLRHVGTSVVAEIDIVNFLTFDRGLIVEISEHVDSAAIERMRNPPLEHSDRDVEPSHGRSSA